MLSASHSPAAAAASLFIFFFCTLMIMVNTLWGVATVAFAIPIDSMMDAEAVWKVSPRTQTQDTSLGVLHELVS